MVDPTITSGLKANFLERAAHLMEGSGNQKGATAGMLSKYYPNGIATDGPEGVVAAQVGLDYLRRKEGNALSLIAGRANRRYTDAMDKATVEDYFMAPELVVVKDPAAVAEILRSYGSVKVADARKSLKELGEQHAEMKKKHEDQADEFHKKYEGVSLNEDQTAAAQKEARDLEDAQKKESRDFQKRYDVVREQAQWVDQNEQARLAMAIANFSARALLPGQTETDLEARANQQVETDFSKF